MAGLGTEWNDGDGSDVMDGRLGLDKIEVNGAAGAGDAFEIRRNGQRDRFDRTNLGPFTLDIGFPVADKVTAPENLKVRKLESPKSATVLYSGKLTDIGEVYRDLYGTLLTSADMKPTSESREHYLYWEGVDSPNNVVMIQVVLK